jgi:riboflavin kinase/FMN adenylyltransferase
MHVSSTVHWHDALDSLGRAVVALGMFDGVHLGHRALISDAAARAGSDGALAAALTFDTDPEHVVHPRRPTPQLLSVEDRVALMTEAGIDLVLVVGFDSATARLAPDEFLDDVLMSAFAPCSVVVGEDFVFGHRAAGDVDTLRAHGEAHGYDVVAHDLVRVDGTPITSTRVRDLVLRGEVSRAAALLGRPHRVSGVVEEGRGIGSALGIPTANLDIHEGFAVPADGVYAARATATGSTWRAGVSVGNAPTYKDAPSAVEAHLIGFVGDLRGQTVRLEFIERLRDQARFDTPDELAAAIKGDLSRVEGIVDI